MSNNNYSTYEYTDRNLDITFLEQKKCSFVSNLQSSFFISKFLFKTKLALIDNMRTYL